MLPRPRRWEALPGPGAPSAATPDVHQDASLPEQGFVLETGGSAPRIRHRDPAGLRYARQALAQLAGGREQLPALRVEDAPDFPVRGLMLDVSRDRVPTRESLARLVELLALFRINHLELYTEHTFAYREHEAVWRDASPMTADDVRWLDALCAEHGVALVANQNTFGHMARWLQHDRYRQRAETPDGFRTRFGMELPASVLAPTEENAAFALALCRELLAAHRTRAINIGCDETFELGQGQSRDAVEARGKGRVYLEHLLRLMRGLHQDGVRVHFWGDILRNHPELVAELPRQDTVALAWHYEAPASTANLPDSVFEIAAEFGLSREAMAGFSGHVDAFAAADVPFWVCPGTSSWNTLIGRWPNARANLLDAAETGRARGAAGYLITDWGDNGHMQPPSVSWLPLAYGAAVSWGIEANRELEMGPLLDAFVFRDRAGQLGRTLEELGSLYAGTGKTALNGSPLFTELVPTGLLGSFGEANAAGTARVIEQPDGALVCRELSQAARLARHGAWRIARAADLPRPPDAELRADLREAIEEQGACWLARSRPGGLGDSLARLEKATASYTG
jgi:hypothetical protein